MKKRIASLLLVLVLLVTVLPGAAAAAASGKLLNFVRVNTYQTGLYKDIATSKWYTPYVQASYEYGLMNGRTAKTFAPNDNMTVAEAVKLAACLHSIYYTGSQSFPAATPWYRPYADYALKNGVISEDYHDYGAIATRSEFAELLAKALPEEALTAKNSVEDNAIPDVPLGFSYAPAVYELYRAGVLTGSDAAGHFLPNNAITRAEVAAIVTRMANAAFRQSITLRLDLTTEQIFDKCSPAVFYIKIFDINDKAVKTGSGFFIGEDGLAVTNFHVMIGAEKAVVTTADGKEHNVLGIYDYSKEKDFALIKVDGSGFPYLKTADSDSVVTGADTWAIGSPLGLRNTISKGIISHASRDLDGKTFIQTTAAISPGSSGGALLNSAGEVIGVTTATAASTNSQNLNLALPISLLKDFKAEQLRTLESILPDTKYYENAYPIPDFGAYTGASPFGGDEHLHYYRVADLRTSAEVALNGYAGLLEDNCFSLYGYAIENGTVVTYYANGTYGKFVTLVVTNYLGHDCVRIQIFG
jgi:S1-C subfamily serine protease